MNLYQKIAEVMKDVQYLQKDDKISYKEINYRAISEEKVTSSVRASLLKHGLVILPIKQEHTKEGTLTTVNTDYKIVNIDNPEEFEILTSSGTGVDTQDKGVGKAMTYSYKYLLLRTFAIPTGEDPDKTSSAELDDKQVSRTMEKYNDVLNYRVNWNGKNSYLFTDEERKKYTPKKGATEKQLQAGLDLIEQIKDDRLIKLAEEHEQPY